MDSSVVVSWTWIRPRGKDFWKLCTSYRVTGLSWTEEKHLDLEDVLPQPVMTFVLNMEAV